MAARDQLLDRDIATELAIMGARDAAQPTAAVLPKYVVAIVVTELRSER
jgi:hypothetical protein